MHVIGHLVLGLAAGVAARLLITGRDPGGMVVAAVLGMLGALIGGYVSSFYKTGRAGGFGLAAVGAVLLLAGHHAAVASQARKATLPDPPGVYLNFV